MVTLEPVEHQVLLEILGQVEHLVTKVPQVLVEQQGQLEHADKLVLLVQLDTQVELEYKDLQDHKVR